MPDLNETEAILLWPKTGNVISDTLPTAGLALSVIIISDARHFAFFGEPNRKSISSTDGYDVLPPPYITGSLFIVTRSDDRAIRFQAY